MHTVNVRQAHSDDFWEKNWRLFSLLGDVMVNRMKGQKWVVGNQMLASQICPRSAGVHSDGGMVNFLYGMEPIHLQA